MLLVMTVVTHDSGCMGVDEKQHACLTAVLVIAMCCFEYHHLPYDQLHICTHVRFPKHVLLISCGGGVCVCVFLCAPSSVVGCFLFIGYVFFENHVLIIVFRISRVCEGVYCETQFASYSIIRIFGHCGHCGHCGLWSFRHVCCMKSYLLVFMICYSEQGLRIGPTQLFFIWLYHSCVNGCFCMLSSVSCCLRLCRAHGMCYVCFALDAFEFLRVV